MTAFQYRALDADGRELAGVIDADSARQARGELRQRQLLPVAVSAVGAESAGRRQGLSGRRRVLLTRQWASLLAAGLTLAESLDSLIDQHEDPHIKRVLSAVRATIGAGLPLHRALADAPRAFPPIYVALVRAGEQSGSLPQVLLALAAYLEHQAEVRRRTLAALLYPAIVSTVGILIVLALMIYVVPQVTAVFAHGQRQLPLLTRLLIGFGHIALPTTLAAAALGGAGLLLGRRLLAQGHRQWRFHALLLRLPLVGRLLRVGETARFAATLAILARGGVPLLAALATGGAVLRLRPLADAVQAASRAVAAGAPLARALAADGAFPSLLTHLVAAGERSGRQPEMLERAATLLQAEVDDRLATLTTLLEPLLILLMGGIVLTVVLAIMQPILEVNQLLR
jgi:general secretion pathway protein F